MGIEFSDTERSCRLLYTYLRLPFGFHSSGGTSTSPHTRFDFASKPVVRTCETLTVRALNKENRVICVSHTAKPTRYAVLGIPRLVAAAWFLFPCFLDSPPRFATIANYCCFTSAGSPPFPFSFRPFDLPSSLSLSLAIFSSLSALPPAEKPGVSWAPCLIVTKQRERRNIASVGMLIPQCLSICFFAHWGFSPEDLLRFGFWFLVFGLGGGGGLF